MLIVFMDTCHWKKKPYKRLFCYQRFAISLLSQKFEFRVSPPQKKIDLKHEILNYAIFKKKS